jgi:hydroxysqualene dehydroxylase
MKKVVVIGGGLAGLSASSFLSDSGFQIELLEASPKPGGRAYSFIDNESGIVIDNGQHILMGCYKETLKFFKLIGAERNLSKEPCLSLNFVNKNFEFCPLQAAGQFYPINLLVAFIKYSALSSYEKLLFLKFIAKIYLYADKDLKKMTVTDWLIKENQTENLIKSFWEILAVAAMNTDINKASAYMFAVILKEIFFRGNDSSTIILPAVGLSDTYCNDAVRFITENGGNISFSEQVIHLKFQESTIREIVTTKRVISGFNSVISAIPLYALKKIINSPNYLSSLDFDYSSILTVHLFLKENKFRQAFYGLLDSPVQWVFNKGSHLSVVISNADKFIGNSKEEIIDLILSELNKYIQLERTQVLNFRILKEKRAAFIPSNDIIDKRPTAITPFKNFFLAGDWTSTGLPATIESAVKSGKLASEAVQNL